MVRPAVVAACFVLIAGCGTPAPDSGAINSDQIQELVDRLSADRSGDWVNGLYPALNLPPSATVEELLDRMFQMVSFDEGSVSQFRILELRGVQIASPRPERYNVALVETNLGRKLVLFRRGRVDWWSRVYEVEPST